MNSFPSDHPIWPIIRMLVRQFMPFASGCFALWLFYDKVDPRDIKTVLLMIFGAACGEGANRLMKTQETKPKESDP